MTPDLLERIGQYRSRIEELEQRTRRLEVEKETLFNLADGLATELSERLRRTETALGDIERVVLRWRDSGAA